jgi:acylphosphatase
VDPANSHGHEARRIRIEGLVQGVFFRRTAREEAESLGLAGWAHNEDDGTVTIVVEGDPESLDAFVSWCHEGPPRSQVERVRVDPAEYSGLHGFHIT